MNGCKMTTDSCTEFFSQLYDALTDEPRRIQELRESLKARGVDVDRTLDMARQLIANHRKHEPVAARADRLVRAFIEGAKWWEWEKTGCTMWQSDQRRALEVAETRLEKGTLGQSVEEMAFVAHLTPEGDSMDRPVLVTTAHRGVFAGLLTLHDGTSATLNELRMCIYWSADVKGVLGLASHGPTESCRITRDVPSGRLTGITAVIDLTPEAWAAWRRQPWK